MVLPQNAHPLSMPFQESYLVPSSLVPFPASFLVPFPASFHRLVPFRASFHRLVPFQASFRRLRSLLRKVPEYESFGSLVLPRPQALLRLLRVAKGP